MENAIREAYKIKMQIKFMEQKYEAFMEQIKRECKGESTRWGNYRIVVTSRPGVIEYNAIPELKSINLDIYRKPSINVYKIECLGE